MRLKYKNLIFQVLKDSSLGIDNFLFEETSRAENYNTYQITFLENSIPSKFNFIIRELQANFNLFDCHFTVYSPAFEYSKFFPNVDHWPIEDICRVLNTWVEAHISAYLDDKEEIDLWEEYLRLASYQQTETIDLTNTDNFTYDEKQQIKLAIQNLELSIAQNFSLSAEQLKLVNANLKYLAEGVDRLNKVDWKTILIGQFFTISTAIATSPHQFNQLYQMFLKVIHIIYFLPQ